MIKVKVYNGVRNSDELTIYYVVDSKAVGGDDIPLRVGASLRDAREMRNEFNKEVGYDRFYIMGIGSGFDHENYDE